MPLSDEKLALFVQSNHQFSTSENGRLTSLYFEDMDGNQGRWRREHPGGECLFFQGKSRRLFMDSDELRNYMGDLEVHDWRTPQKFGGRARGDYNVLCLGKDIRNLSLCPFEGWHVLELCPPQYYARHGSSGTVLLNDNSAVAAAYNSIGDIMHVDWSSE